LIIGCKHIIIIGFCLLLWGNTLANALQDSIYIHIQSDTALPATIQLNTPYFESEEIAKQHVGKLITVLRAEGYFAASVDSFELKNDSLFAYLNIGKAYQQLNLNITNLPDAIKKQIKLPLEDEVLLDWEDWTLLTEKLLQYGENNGYPFSTVKLQEVSVNDSIIHAKVYHNLSKKYSIDSIEIRGTAKINRNYIENYLDLKKGAIYNERKIGLINQKLLELPFVKTYRSPAVEFFDNKARLFLFMNDEKVNRFDF